MSTYGGIRKVSGDSWTDEEMQHVRALQAKMDKKRVQHMKKEGLDFQLIAIPLGDVKGWGKYSRDVEVKKFSAPYQPINPYRFRKLIVD